MRIAYYVKHRRYAIRNTQLSDRALNQRGEVAQRGRGDSQQLELRADEKPIGAQGQRLSAQSRERDAGARRSHFERLMARLGVPHALGDAVAPGSFSWDAAAAALAGR